jgi:hypothetical protein
MQDERINRFPTRSVVTLTLKVRRTPPDGDAIQDR